MKILFGDINFLSNLDFFPLSSLTMNFKLGKRIKLVGFFFFSFIYIPSLYIPKLVKLFLIFEINKL